MKNKVTPPQFNQVFAIHIERNESQGGWNIEVTGDAGRFDESTGYLETTWTCRAVSFVIAQKIIQTLNEL